jgi:hypothetical protein
MLLFVVRLCVQSFSFLLLLRRLHSSFQTFVFCISSVVFFAPLVGKKKHKRESLFSQNSSNNERTKKLTEEKESEILTERDMKLRTRDDESVFVLLLRVVSSIFCPLFVSGGGCCRCGVVFFAFNSSFENFSFQRHTYWKINISI